METMQETTFVELMDATEEYMLATGKLNEAIKKGLFHISQARYAYQVPLGQAQYHAEMEACAHVHVQGTDCSDADDNIGIAPDGPVVFKLHTSLGTHQPSQPVCRASASDSDHDQTQTQASNSQSQQPTLPQDGRRQEERSTYGSGAGDPLRWWGVLVPPALRSAQKDFMRAVELATAVANAKSRLNRALCHMHTKQMPAPAPAASSNSQTKPLTVC